MTNHQNQVPHHFSSFAIREAGARAFVRGLRREPPIGVDDDREVEAWTLGYDLAENEPDYRDVVRKDLAWENDDSAPYVALAATTDGLGAVALTGDA